MTIQVKISHGVGGHPAPFYVTKLSAAGEMVDQPAIVKDGDTITVYIHSNQHLAVTERQPGAAE